MFVCSSLIYDAIDMLLGEQNLEVKRKTYLEYINPDLLEVVSSFTKYHT